LLLFSFPAIPIPAAASIGSDSSAAVSSANSITDSLLFSDVSNHWAKDTIVWGKTNNIVNGYPDGTFRPDTHVSEAEFLSMFIKAFGVPLAADLQTWSNPIYSYIAQMNYPVLGTTDLTLRDAKINRLLVAEIITGANGFNFKGNDAVQYILGSQLSKGKTSATISGYMGSDNLTRAEAIQFIKNLLDQGMTKLKPRPAEVSSTELLPPLPIAAADLPPVIATTYASLQKIMKSYPGYSLKADADHIGITKVGFTLETINFVPAKKKGQVSITYLYSDQSQASLSLAIEMLKAQALALKDDFSQQVAEAMTSGDKLTEYAGATEIVIAPTPQLTSNVEFWYTVN